MVLDLRVNEYFSSVRFTPNVHWFFGNGAQNGFIWTAGKFLHVNTATVSLSAMISPWGNAVVLGVFSISAAQLHRVLAGICGLLLGDTDFNFSDYWPVFPVTRHSAVVSHCRLCSIMQRIYSVYCVLCEYSCAVYVTCESNTTHHSFFFVPSTTVSPFIETIK